ncbi:Uncharacterised protein [Vibrio cholerae]|nr:Uncharacterised protein [Vibrio cholerae]
MLCLLCLLCVRYINLFVTQMLILLSGKEWMRDAEHKNCLFVVQRAEYWRVW